MRPQYLNYVNSSFVLFLDNYILIKTSGFYSGLSTKFYPTNNKYNNLFTYQSPYSNFIIDSSITTPITGIYINNMFITTGTSGFVGLNADKGQVYFSNNIGNNILSGVFATKEVAVLPLTISEEKLLFETRFNPRPKTSSNSISFSNVTGLAQDSYTYPAIYVKGFSNFSVPHAFGGLDLSTTNVGLMIVSENSFQCDAIKSILSDMREELVPFLTDFPFDIYGNYKITGQNYNYDSWVSGALFSGKYMYIDDVVVNSFKREYNLDSSKLNPDVFFAIADVTLCKNRFPRNSNNL